MVTSKHLAFVSAAYNVLLDRDPGPAGLKHWSECLANGLSKTQFLRAVEKYGVTVDDFLAGLAITGRV